MDIKSILNEYRVPFRSAGQHEHARHGWVQIDCPFCSPRSSRFRLGINLVGGYANCWSCGHRRLLDVLHEALRLPYSECNGLLGRVGWARPERAPVARGRFREPKGVGPLWAPHRRYLEKRGFDPDLIQELWDVQGIGIASRLAWRLWIPIHLEGHPVSWTSRSIGDADHSKYITAKPDEEDVTAKTLLYGEDYVRQVMVICEGPLDVWAIGPGAVATFGLSYTRDQFFRMVDHPVRVVCFDSEPSAQLVARRLVDELKLWPGETYNVELQTGKDPAECDGKELEDLRGRFLSS